MEREFIEYSVVAGCFEEDSRPTTLVDLSWLLRLKKQVLMPVIMKCA